MSDDKKTAALELTPREAPARAQVSAWFKGEPVGSFMIEAAGTQQITVGSDDACALHVKRPGVSRKHVELTLGSRGVRAKDLGSTNGTRYQGSRLTDAVVPLGAVLVIGQVELRIETPSPDALQRFGPVATAAPVFAAALKVLARAALVDSTVLLEGETGTGKDVLARTLHAEGPRAKGPFEVVDCGALARELAAAELFGHERGAFTGADRARAGALERAKGGTLFLDEVGELPLDLQPLLLRALEARQVKRVGGEAFIDIDVRVVAATHRDLDARVKEGAFRADLLHRLAVVRVKVPRLADRLEDLPLVARSILDALGPRAAGLSLSEDTLAQLARQPWPGNVRELRNFLERAAALGTEASSPGGPSQKGQPASLYPADYREAREQAVEAFERDFAKHIVDRAGGNVTRAARDAGIARGYLHDILKKHAIVARKSR